MISLAIVSLDNHDYLRLLLKSIRLNTLTPYEVLVYGNLASDEFKAVVDANKDIITTSIYSSVNDFISSPLNTLFKHATGEYFVFLDDDTYLAPGWDIALLNKVSPNTLHQYLAFNQFIPNSKESNYFNTYDFGREPGTFREEEFNSECMMRRNIVKDQTLLGGNFLVKRELWQTIGGYDESIPMYGSDIEFKIHIYKAAVKKSLPFEFRTVADACVYHFNNGCSHRKMTERVGAPGRILQKPRVVSFDPKEISRKHGMSPSEWEVFTQGMNQYFS